MVCFLLIFFSGMDAKLIAANLERHVSYTTTAFNFLQSQLPGVLTASCTQDEVCQGSEAMPGFSFSDIQCRVVLVSFNQCDSALIHSKATIDSLRYDWPDCLNSWSYGPLGCFGWTVFPKSFCSGVSVLSGMNISCCFLHFFVFCFR